MPGPAPRGPFGAIPPQVLERIERLFAEAANDRDKALELEALLDEHGLFRQFENRFLDLFKSAS